MCYRCSAFLFIFFYCFNAVAETALVAVASNMSHTIQEIAAEFKQQTGADVSLSFGSSGTLTHQIINGSPHELFLSADSNYIARLIEEKNISSETRIYAIGRLCLFIPNRSSFRNTTDFTQLVQRISFGKFNKIAIANPATAPYGRATMISLQSLGIWSFDMRKLVIAENVSQSTQFALTSSVDLAFIPYSHSLLNNVKARGQCLKVPGHLHPPIIQKMMLTQSAGDIAKSFFEFMMSSTAHSILAKHGYGLPNNS